MTMNLFSRSNQNGAPKETAIAVNNQPSTRLRGSGLGTGELLQPIGKPKLFNWHRFLARLHSGVLSVQTAGQPVGGGDLASFVYLMAAATTTARSSRSELSAFTIAMESTLSSIAITNPIIKIKSCARRLYQPDTRSIDALYQSSIFWRAWATSFPAASISPSN